MKVYGVANHSPEHVAAWLKKDHRIKPENIYILPMGKNIQDEPPEGFPKILFMLTTKDLNRNLERLNTKPWARRHVFVFGPPIRIAEYENITLLDIEESVNNPVYGWTLKRTFLPLFDKTNTDGPVIVVPDRTYMSKVIENLKKVGSLLHPMMTSIYTLSSATHQTPVKRLFCNWLYNGGDEKTLDKIFERIQSEIPIAQKLHLKFRALLLGEVGARYIQAFKDIRVLREQNKPIPYPQLAIKYNISAYEMRYITSIVGQEKKYSQFERITVQELIVQMKRNRVNKKAKDKRQALKDSTA